MWIDTHCHLNPEDYLSQDGKSDERENVIYRAKEAGVEQLILIGSGRGESEIDHAVALASKYPQVFAAIAVHPHDVGILDVEALSKNGELVGEPLWEKIEKLALHDRVVAIGETGLDAFYNHSPMDIQEKIFIRFIDLAKRTQKPLSLHVREAHAKALELVRRYGQGDVVGVVHCFTGTIDEALAWVDAGFYISWSGIVTFKKAENLRAIISQIPSEKFVLETDSPFLAPEPFRGKRNEPAWLLETAKVVAKERSISLEELAYETTKTAKKLFCI